MDDRRFDSLVKALAEGKSRRSLIKGLLGLGGAAVIGGAVLETDSQAARRPTPTPKPPSCPGKQTYVNGQCVCQVPPAPGPEKCGPDCCTKGAVPVNAPGYSECCDQACCFGTCFGEELCCPTNTRAGGLPATHKICTGPNGPSCCEVDQQCCLLDGCCDTVCYGGSVGADSCCSLDSFCPGGDTSEDRCCLDGTTCCSGGTNDNYCADFSTGGCCETSDCAPPANGACASECVAGQCQPVVCTDDELCCDGGCVSSDDYEACPADPNQCCVRGEEICCGAGGCCVGDQCNEIVGACCDVLQTPCGTGENACCDELFTCCRNSIDRICCLEGLCTTDGDCCTGDDIACGAECCPEIRCGIHAETGGPTCCDPDEVACGTICCKAATYQCSTTGPGCECRPGTEACGLIVGGCCADGRCNHDTGECCDAGTSPCGSVCCLDGLCDAGVCSCTNGLVRCGEACQECCSPSEVENCQTLYGYDLNCVYCSQGLCDPILFNGSICDTDDTDELGKCEGGYCIPCGGGASAPCTDDSECCSGTCLVDIGQCTDP